MRQYFKDKLYDAALLIKDVWWRVLSWLTADLIVTESGRCTVRTLDVLMLSDFHAHSGFEWHHQHKTQYSNPGYFAFEQ